MQNNKKILQKKKEIKELFCIIIVLTNKRRWFHIGTGF